VKEGAGAFVCGEETALMHSIEGKRGAPRMRPPYPAESGLWGHPTNINNVETYASIPTILTGGADWYARLGTSRSGGTKTFALTGAVRLTGLVEVPIGVSLRQVIFDVGGGIRDGRAFKAVQIGGPSGGCLPAALLDTPVDYEELRATGAIMGSGGMVVVDDTACMVDLTRYFLSFAQEESCGKCVPCRIGTRKMLGMLTRFTRGDGRPGDIERLEQLAHTVQATSLCGLGTTAPNPVLTTLRYFRDEYEAHIHHRRCPAGKCEGLR
ncbi:MAG: SLBB domain-containing protein, partial [Armatimonadetes bacterium]|nr:SLBB domain-containing protein [Armatimonadota bacterium]